MAPPQKAVPPIVSITVFQATRAGFGPHRNPKDAGKERREDGAAPRFVIFRLRKLQKRGAVLALVARVRGWNGKDEGGCPQWGPPHKRQFPQLFPLRFSSKTSGFLDPCRNPKDAGEGRREDGAAPHFVLFRPRKLQNEEPCGPWLPGCEDGTERTKAAVPNGPPHKRQFPQLFPLRFSRKTSGFLEPVEIPRMQGRNGGRMGRLRVS